MWKTQPLNFTWSTLEYLDPFHNVSLYFDAFEYAAANNTEYWKALNSRGTLAQNGLNLLWVNCYGLIIIMGWDYYLL